MDRIRILYFLEDIMQEGFVKALVNKIANDLSIPEDRLSHDVRSGRGGSTVIPEFEKFMEDTMQINSSDVDLLIVAIDGKCKGHNGRIRQLEKYVKKNHPLRDRLVYAVPDPHIERWYIMDQRAFKNGVGVSKAPGMPPYKCEKDYYKNLLRQAFAESDIASYLGGDEYAENIVNNMTSLDSLFNLDAGFQELVVNLRGFFRRNKNN